MNVIHAHNINANSNTIFWKNLIDLEMRNNGVDFEIMEEKKQATRGWHKVTGDLVFDVKMYFTCKSRWVSDSHKTPNPVV